MSDEKLQGEFSFAFFKEIYGLNIGLKDIKQIYEGILALQNLNIKLVEPLTDEIKRTETELFNKKKFIVLISEEVLMQMCLNGLEAYSILNKENNLHRLETYGELWGNETRPDDNTIIYNIKSLSIDTSAHQEQGSVEPNKDALLLKKQLVTSFWPQVDYIGDFHTHPYEHFSEVEEIKGYEFSQDDYEHLKYYSDYFYANNFRVSLVLTISRLHKKSNNPRARINNNTFRFDLGKYRMWLKSYVSYYADKEIMTSAHDPENIHLYCPSLFGLETEYTNFQEIEKRQKKLNTGTLLTGLDLDGLINPDWCLYIKPAVRRGGRRVG